MTVLETKTSRVGWREEYVDSLWIKEVWLVNVVDSKGPGGLAIEIVEEPAVTLRLRVKKGITRRLEMGQ